MVKQEWIKAGTGAPIVVPGQGGQNNGNQNGAGNMSLSQGLAGMPDGSTLKSVSYVGADHVGRPLIKIRYIGASNAHDTIDAVRE